MIKQWLQNGLQFFRDRKIVGKLLLIYLFALGVPMLAIYFATYNHQKQMITEEIQTSVSTLTTNIDTNIDQWYNTMNHITTLLYSSSLLPIMERNAGKSADSYTQLLENQKMNQFFEYLLIQNNDIQNIYIFTQHQNFYTIYNGRMEPNYMPEKEDWYIKTYNQAGKIVFFGSHDSWPLSYSKEKVFSLAREIRGLDGHSLGVLLIDVKIQSLQNILERFPNKYKTDFLIFDKEEGLIYQNVQPEHTLSDSAKLHLLSMFQKGRRLAYDTLDNERFLLTLNKSESSPFQIAGITPESSIQEFMTPLYKTIGMAVAFSLLALALSLFLLYLTLVKPVCQLNDSIERASASHFKLHAKVRSKDEIGKLSVSFNSMIDEINRLIQQEYKLALLNKDAEISALQSQINPHFLYNTLQLISSIAIVKKVPEIQEVTQALGQMMRFAIGGQQNTLSPNLVPFNQELKHVESYITIQKIRMEDRIRILASIDPTVNRFAIMRLTIQPFVENAFTHGFRDKQEMGTVSLSVTMEGIWICIVVEDDGDGMDTITLKKLIDSLQDADDIITTGHSIGIRNVSARLRLIYQQEYKLSIESQKNQGTKVTLLLPSLPC